MAVSAKTELPRAMLIDMDAFLSAYGRPEIAWHTIANEFAGELPPYSRHEVATTVLAFARQFWSTAEPAWRLKLGEARRLTVKGGFAALARGVHRTLPDHLANRLATASPPIARRKCSSFPARIRRSTS